MPSAALIPVLSFVAMTAPPQTGVTILSSGLAAGILIDATIVRCLLAPAGAGPDRAVRPFSVTLSRASATSSGSPDARSTSCPLISRTSW